MSEPAETVGTAGRSRRRGINIALFLLALALVAGSVVLFRQGGQTSGDSRAETLSELHSEVTKAATDQTKAFLTIDYKNMDPLIEKVLDGATGDFKEQYERAQVTLKASAQESQATSTGKVLEVGVADIDDTNAIVFVAADSQVTNKSTKDKPQSRYYRLKLSMERKGDTWRTSTLQFVG